ncbi:DUF3971 domain-containing protein [Sinorhizobium sp. BG8]|uniref:YhdP family protein n=1 Tax=Sinorhizobium sp. BG8 TaxID=2613773 RepID=UPI00193E0554|nr:DUF3971 domain-containing protein [Sinorhizobium sp. BG8]QRM55613.1 hypothetical protein F3Y30_14580 [Sinorhizobium sp. BG8]
MGEIRGEKVVFKKTDIVCLHELPSAQAEDPMVLKSTSGPSKTGLACKVIAWVTASAVVLVGLIAAAVESGIADGPLNAQAVAALNRALGPDYRADVEHTVLRLSGWGGLALKAEDVSLAEAGSGQKIVTTKAISLVMDPLSLLSGRVSVSKLDIDGAMLDPSLLPQGGAFDASALRISDVPDYAETAFTALDDISRLIVNNGLEKVRVSDMGVSLKGSGDTPVALSIQKLEFVRAEQSQMQIRGDFAIDDRAGSVDLTATGEGGVVKNVAGTLKGVGLSPFLLKKNEGLPHSGINAAADLRIDATRGTTTASPVLTVGLSTSEGEIYADGISADLLASNVAASYNFDKGTIEISPSNIRIGASSFPFTGGLIDLDRLPNQTQKGFAIDLLVRDGTMAPSDTGEVPTRFDAKARGQFLPASRELTFPEMAITSERGSLAGSLSVLFGQPAPEISFVALANQLESAAVKQFWPFWMAKNARRWVIGNIFGGTVTNGRIEAFISGDRKIVPGKKLELRGDDLKISFDIAGARMNVAGDIPPLRDTSGRFELTGERAVITINGGAAYFQSGRSVTLTGGTFILPDTYAKPLMADMDINVAGNADAIAELVTYRPIGALQRTGFMVDDFTGSVSANVKARFGLVKNQNPPAPVWTADMALTDVTVKKPIANRNVSDLTGSLVVTPSRADLDAKADIDGVPMQVVLVEPVDKSTGTKREVKITGTLDNAARRKLLPGFDDLLEGPVGIEVTSADEGGYRVVADLDRTAVSIPWIGWTKGAGIGATAKFVVRSENNSTSVSDFTFGGEGFAVEGALAFDNSTFTSAKFSRVSLSPQDRYRISVERKGGSYAINVDGEFADVRPLLAKLKSGSSGQGDGGESSGNKGATVRAKLGSMGGFNGETLTNVSLTYAFSGQKITALDLAAVTAGGSPVVAKLGAGDRSNVVEFTSGDAGAIARFADIYRHMQGGLLNVRMRAGKNESWRGSVDIRKFSLVGEDRLKSIVSTPTGENGRSLNDAVRRDIDVSTVRFDRGFARVEMGGGALSVENGVVRGEMVGATFQGMVRDASGRMEMTGTFMPAYGLNRLFAELPLIGVILGNGRDRGLIGITFKLSGNFDKPQLTINPLSIIAPGVFRNIFEFQ